MDVELSVGELPLVRADPVQLERALSNLLQNARRHAAGHGVRLSGTAGNGTAVRIVVSDRGPGVPDSLGEEAFEPFRS